MPQVLGMNGAPGLWLEMTEFGWDGERGLGVVEGDLEDGGGGGGEVGGVLRGGMVAPGADGVEVGEEVGGKVRGQGFTIELGGEAGGEVLRHDEGDEQGVARLPEGGGVVEDVELDGEGVEPLSRCGW